MFRTRTRHERANESPPHVRPHRSILGRVSAAAAVAALAVGGLSALAAAPAYADETTPPTTPPSSAPPSDESSPPLGDQTAPPVDSTGPSSGTPSAPPSGLDAGEPSDAPNAPAKGDDGTAPGARSFTTQGEGSHEPSPGPTETTDKQPVVNIETLEACEWYEAEGFVEVGVLHKKQIAHGFLLLDGKPVKEDRWLHFDLDVPSGQHTVTLVWWDESWKKHSTSTTFTIGPCPVLGVTAQPTCSLGETGTATITVTGILEKTHYEWWVKGDGFSDSGSYSEPFDVSGLAPGAYTVKIKAWHYDRDGYDWVWAKTSFTVAPCAPTIAVHVTQCSVPGGTASVLIELGDLVAGVEYEVKVTDQGSPGGTPYGGVHSVTGSPDGTAQITVSGLPVGKSFTAWVNGTWPGQQAEALRVRPVDPVDLAAHADLSTEPCPVPPPTPPAPADPASLVFTGGTLAATGSESAPLLGLGLVGIGLGGVVLAASAIRRRLTTR